ncbi:MAG TPA: acetyl/propionyl/methylcrotonyl-CoA carboxylase subunit alpha [Caulobacterales bacterium]|nr:acetyl/propionyl/methylcrotonyl-CoA carboxylase subunit alpha [Caulobacterales bacterium]
MLKSVLIANRGEIARRVMRTCKRLGVRTVAVYSDADAKALHVREADASVHIGPSPAKESYLCGDKIIAAAKETGAEAIHPGYGFLSENADFAQAVLDAGLIWIGPRPDSIRAMGLKDAAKKLMAEAGVPVTPGYLGEDQSEAKLLAEAEKIGFPVLIKAVAGGGGKGMRKVEKKAEFKAALASAKREAAAAFGDDRVLMETYVQRPRHIEVQVFGDTHGNVVHLFERDCSLQRRHQKVIEEAPAPGMDEATREALCSAAVRAAKAVNYVNAGTIEFIADASDGLRADRIWFMEMNTRLQVEHPVTEEITGQDLVEWQLRVASGEKLPLKQEELKINGHAIEARLYAENPETGFLPSTGRLDWFYEADRHDVVEGAHPVRIDTGFDRGDEVTSYYDPMLAKIVAHAARRDIAIAKLRVACANKEVAPVRSNAGFLARCLSHEEFVSGRVDTGLIAANLDALTRRPAPSAEVMAAAARAFVGEVRRRPVRRLPPTVAEATTPWLKLDGFRLNAPARMIVNMVCEGAPCMAQAADAAKLGAFARGDRAFVFHDGDMYEFSLDTGERAEGEAAAGDGAILSPMPGKIVSVSVKAGAKVKKGEPLVTLEAMKMEHALAAPFDGVVAELKARAGEQVSEGALLARLEKS